MAGASLRDMISENCMIPWSFLEEYQKPSGLGICLRVVFWRCFDVYIVQDDFLGGRSSGILVLLGTEFCKLLMPYARKAIRLLSYGMVHNYRNYNTLPYRCANMYLMSINRIRACAAR